MLQDNPAVYSFFFDTSRKRTCYIAPERFIDEQTTKSFALDVDRADIFSLGYNLIMHSPLVSIRILACVYVYEFICVLNHDSGVGKEYTALDSDIILCCMSVYSKFSYDMTEFL